jgi:hypothetical protein
VSVPLPGRPGLHSLLLRHALHHTCFTATEIVETVDFTDSYPFDQVSLQSIAPRTYDASGPGLHAGGWLGYRVKDYLALGADLRFSWGRMSFTTTAGSEIEFSSGGARLGGGARFFF